MPDWLSWILEELAHLRQFPKVAVVLVVLAGGGGWYLASLLYKTQVSNLKSEVALLKSRLEAEDGGDRPLPIYPLGGSNVLVYSSAEWTTQDTAKRVELDWNRLGDVEAYAVLRIRAEGESASRWAQARVVDFTNDEVVATTERHQGGVISIRLQLPRGVGSKTYGMQIRGESAGLEGHIEFVAAVTKP